MISPRQLVVIYDGTCGFCSNLARLIGRLDWRRAIVWMPSQTAGLGEVVGLSETQLSEAAWAVLPSGDRRRGAGALLTAKDALLPMGMPCFHALYRLPPVAWLADACYRWVAANRGRFPGRATCDLAWPAPLEPGDAAELRRRRLPALAGGT